MIKKIFAANWKMNKNPYQALTFCQGLVDHIHQNSQFCDQRELFIFPQNFSLMTVVQECKGAPIDVGPQHIHTELSGAFTGENSVEIAHQIGAELVLLGHSERRQYFNETNEFIAKKVKTVQTLKMLPVLCIGETLEQRQAGQTVEVCKKQLQESLLGSDLTSRIVIAYEPVWAIGTGQVATPEQVKETHQKLFEALTEMGLQHFQLLYGGSVKPDNAKELLKIPYVDGFLIGGAALELQSFIKICEAFEV